MELKSANIPLFKGASHNAPTRIILHAMGEFIDTDGRDYYAPEWLKKLGLSAHCLITPSGVAIKCREFSEGAYHAKSHNTNTLGIEFLVGGLHTYETFLHRIEEDWLTDEAYATGLKVVREYLARMNGVGSEVIKTHSQISPTRKFDPGKGFPLEKFLDAL